MCAILCFSIMAPALGNLHHSIHKSSKVPNLQHISHANSLLRPADLHGSGSTARAHIKHRSPNKAAPPAKKVVKQADVHKTKSKISTLSKMVHSSIPLHKDGIAIQPPAKWAGFNPRHASEILEVRSLPGIYAIDVCSSYSRVVQTYLEQHPSVASEAMSWVIVGVVFLIIATSLLLFSEVIVYCTES